MQKTAGESWAHSGRGSRTGPTQNWTCQPSSHMAAGDAGVFVFCGTATNECPMFQWVAPHPCSYGKPWLNSVGIKNKTDGKEMQGWKTRVRGE